MKLTSIAISYAQAGLSVVPTRPKEKKAFVPWIEFQTRIADEDEINEWFRKHPSASIGCIGGAVSGGFEIMDIDNHLGDARENFEAFKELVINSEPGLWGKLVIETTQGGGYHIMYRCEKVGNNTKLARRWNAANKEYEVIFETRGEGGYALVAPSRGYELIQGELTKLQTITADERGLLISTALSFDEETEETAQNEPVGTVAPPPLKKADVRPASGLKPGEDFNERGDITPILQNAGWILLKEYPSGKQEWKRPGKKERGASATFNAQDGKMETPNKFFVFSSNALPFEQDRSYSKFEVFTILECDNDRKEAVRRLAALGYGDQTRKKSKGLNASVSGYDSPDVKKEAEEAEENKPKWYPLTDLGNAERFVDQWRGKIKYNHSTKKWHLWDGKRWKKDETGRISDYIHESVRSIPDYVKNTLNEDIAKAVKAWAKTSESKGKLAAIPDIAKDNIDVGVTAEQFDSHINYINLGNGVYDLDAFTLLPHDPEFLLSHIIDIDYNQKAECDNWRDSLDMYFAGDIEVIEFIQKACGLTLYGYPLEEHLFFLYGLGRNGKSVFADVLEMIFGEYARAIPAELLVVSGAKNFDPEKPSPVAARLKGARFARTSEMPGNQKLDETGVKNLTSKNKLLARQLNENPFEFQPTHTVWAMGNHKPNVVGGDRGIWRRVVLIPFEHEIKKEFLKPPTELYKIFHEEREGILKWMIDGWRLYKEEGFDFPPLIETACKDYQQDEDALADFFEAKCIFDPDSKTGTHQRDFYQAYVKWCEDDKQRIVFGKKTFNKAVEERGYKRVDSGHGRNQLWAGITLINEEGQESIDFV